MLTLFKNEEDLDNFAMTLYNCFTKGMPQSGQRIRKKKTFLKFDAKVACKQVKQTKCGLTWEPVGRLMQTLHGIHPVNKSKASF